MKRLFALLSLALLIAAPKAYAYDDAMSEKVNFAFAMGWCGLGTETFNGLQTADGAYGTRPWFNSWQLELTFNIANTGKVRLFTGLGYESSVFLMNYPWVFVDASSKPFAFAAYNYNEVDDQGVLYLPDPGIYETRLVSRYITIPIGFDINITKKASIGLTGILGINYTSTNTGLKYSYDGMNMPEYYDYLNDLVEPVKFDFRFNVSYSFFSIFVQVPTLSLLKNMTQNAYPLKVGIMLKF